MPPRVYLLNKLIRTEQEASAGTAITSGRLIVADKIRDGKASPGEAGTQAATLIAEKTAQREG